MAVGMVIFMLFLYIAVIGVAIADYVMTSLSLYTIAQRRGVPNPWLAWIPVVSSWTLGDIVDEYDGRNGLKRKWRVALLVLSIIVLAAFVLTLAIVIGMISSLAAMSNYYSYYGYFENSYNPMSGVMGLIVFMYIAVIAASIALTALTALKHICLYKVFESTVPEKSLKYMLFSLLVPLAGSICLLKCRYLGYPEPEYFGQTPPTRE